uniref:tyrosine-type recombinase/integrase n=1 Tax=Acetatifactor sp. TaxID=1872090 RepID=UPI00405607C3
MSTTQPIRDTTQIQKIKEYYKITKPNIRNYMLIIIGLNTALRISDILHIKYGDIYHFEKKEWRSHLMIKEQKTGKTNRIYINKEIRNILDKYTDLTAISEDDWLFESQIQKTKPLSRYQAFRIIKEAAGYVGLDTSVSCHSLRKTFGYHAWKQGTPPALLMDIYNHSSYRITRRYLGIDQDDKDKVFEEICL